MWSTSGRIFCCIVVATRLGTATAGKEQALLGTAAVGAVTADLHPGDGDVELALALDLSLEAFEQVALKLHDLAATQAGHVEMITLRTALVEVTVAFQVQQVQFVDQAVALKEADGAVDRDPVDGGVDAVGTTQDLGGVEVLLGGFDNAKDDPALACHSQAAGGQFRLQPARSLGGRHGHDVLTPYAKPTLGALQAQVFSRVESLVMSNGPSQAEPKKRSLRHRVGIAGLSLLLVLVVAAITATAWLYLAAGSSLPQVDGTIRLRGLNAPVSIIRDQQGVPHIRASNLTDLFFAQGYVTAQDRLWQMDMTRRYAAGELAEVLGPALVESDRWQRTLLLRRVAEQSASLLNEPERSHLEAYARGVNAYIEQRRDSLPLEFRILRYQPRPWKVEDSFLVGSSMVEMLNFYLFRRELARKKITARLSPEQAADLYPSRSRHDQPPQAEVPPVEPVPGPPKAQIGTAPRKSASLSLPVPLAVELELAASNNWVVSGAHTVSGRPLLSNDMHLPHRIPNTWYETHLTAGDFDVAGVTLPGLPYVIVGHNRRIAWGFTNLGPDVLDVFIERFNQQGEYLTPEGWQKPETQRERIHVKAGEDHELTILITRHGPVVSHLLEGEKQKLALRWTLHDAGTFGLPFFRVNSASDWQEFRQAFSHLGAPGQNVVYADVDGHIGYQATGSIPIRASGDGSLPVEGASGAGDWIGYVPYGQLPSIFDPPSGVLATANGRIASDGYPYHLTAEPASPWRTNRIYRLLQAGGRLSATDMLDIQNDVYSQFDHFLALRLAAAAEHSPEASSRARQAAEILRASDGVVSADSVAPRVVDAAEDALWRLMLKPWLGEDYREYQWFMSSVALENILREHPPRWLTKEHPSYDALLLAALESGLEAAPAELRSWKWGEYWAIEVQHPVLGEIPVLRRWSGTGVWPQSGNRLTVKQVSRDFGPSQRMTVDLADLDHSTLNILTGQSGHILSSHYMDQWRAWYEGRSFALPFSPQAVDKAAADRLRLEPAR